MGSQSWAGAVENMFTWGALTLLIGFMWWSCDGAPTTTSSFYQEGMIRRQCLETCQPPGPECANACMQPLTDGAAPDPAGVGG